MLQLPALSGEVDTQHLRGQLRQHPRGSDHSNEISDGESDRNLVVERRTLGLGEIEVRNRIHGRTDRGRFGQRTSHESRCGAGVITKKPGDEPRHCEARRCDDRGQRRMLQAVALQATEKLRPGAKSDREEEQEEKALLDLVGQREAPLADQYTRQQRAGDGSELETPQRQLAEEITEAEHDEERDLGVSLQRFLQPLHGLLLRKLRHGVVFDGWRSEVALSTVPPHTCMHIAARCSHQAPARPAAGGGCAARLHRERRTTGD